MQHQQRRASAGAPVVNLPGTRPGGDCDEMTRYFHGVRLIASVPRKRVSYKYVRFSMYWVTRSSQSSTSANIPVYLSL